MSSSNKVTLAKLCKQHYHMLPVTNHIYHYLLPRCLSSVFTKISIRKAKQFVAFGLLLLASTLTTSVSAQTVVNICDRTVEVEARILAAISPTPACDAVTSAQLAAITSLSLFSMNIETLASGDFDDLTGLTELDLRSNSLTTLPAGVFDNLTSLTTLDLEFNTLTTLPAGVFDNLTSLTFLSLFDNDLTTLPAGVFDNLTSLTTLDLELNALTTLPAGLFNALTNLPSLSLRSNDLSTLPADVFDNLTGLTELDLSGNSLTALPADVFDDLTSLTELDLRSNSLTILPADVFDNLTSLTTLGLNFNNLITTLPAGVFDGLISLTELRLDNNSLTTLPDNIFDNLTSLTELRLSGNLFTTPLPANLFDPVPSTATIEINLSPIGDLPNVALTVSSTTTINVANAFISRDGAGNDRALSFTITPANTAVATATETGGVVTITGAGMGATTVSVTADDGRTFGSSMFTRDIAVTVEMGICDRTPLVEAAILAAISPTPACANVTSAQLAAITSLDLSSMSISTLQSDDFAGLIGLTRLDLDDNTLTELPDDVFENLTNLTELHLDGNTFTTPLPANIFDSLPNDSLIEIDLAPIDFAVALDTSGMITIDLAEAFISRDSMGTDRALSYSAISSNNMAVATVSESGGMLTVTATGNGATTVSVTASDGVSTNAMNAIAVAVEMGICDRTVEVEARILAAISPTPACDAVTSAQLAAITSLSLFSMNIETLASGDFDDLTGLTELDLRSNSLTTLPAGVFDNLTSLTTLDLEFNTLTTLPAGVFDNLTSLTFLSLFDNDLTTLPAGVFDNLTSLTTLDLELNALTTLPAGLFNALTNLPSLSLRSNDLSTLPADVFDNLTGLTELDLSGNSLTALPADVFDDLTSLTELDLRSNSLTILPADVFDNLTSLTTLGLNFNNLITTLPAGVFDGLISLTELRLDNNSLTTLPDNIFDNLTSLTELRLSGNLFTTPLPANLFDPVPSTATIEINLSPIGDLPNVALTVSSTTTINVANAFISRDGAGNDRALSFTITPANTAVATATETGGVVTITGAGMGATTVSVTADDGRTFGSSMFTRDIAVTVEMGICDRTPLVEAAILAAISPTPACANVTSAQLAAITSLDLSSMSISTLQSDDFAGLIGLTRLDLDDNTLTELPDDVFENLTNLTELHLDGNTFTTPLPANIFDSLPNDSLIEIDLAPIDFAVALDTSGMITIDLAEAFISRDSMGTDRALSYSAISSNNMAVATVSESGGMLTVTATGNGATTVSVTASDGVSTNAMNAIAVAVEMGICDRTVEVEARILAAISPTPACDAVTSAQLAAITSLSLFSMNIETLASGDFDDLTGLTELDLRSNSLTTLPAGVFDNLTSLTTLDLEFNTLTTLPAGVFDNLTSLTFLSLFDNDLTTLPAGVFDNLTSLTTLDLELNALTTLPAGLFNALTNLPSLSLRSNDLSTLPADVFDNLTGLTELDLSGNSLTALPADVFDDLTSLTELDLRSNSLTILPADVFDNLTSLTTLGLNFNNLITTLPAGVFDGLISLTELRLDNNSLTTLPDNIFDNLTSLTELRLSGNLFTTPLPANLFDPVPSTATIEINLSPIGDLPNVALTVSSTTTINVANAFISRDGAGNDRALSFTITPANTAVATATETGGVVTITGAGMGATTVSVTADDGRTFGSSMFTRDIAVTVAEAGILAFDEATGNTAATVVADENSGTMMFHVQLASPPASDVTMTVMSSNINEGTVMPGTLTFTAANWNSRQAITVTAVPDNVDSDDSFTVDFVIATGDGGNYEITTTLSSVTVTITDDDTAGIALFDATTGIVAPDVTTTEGATTDTFYVALTSEPTAGVTVAVTSTDTGEGTITAGASLTFTTANWNTPRQAITITGVDDDVVDGDETYDLTLTPSGGGYDSVTAATVSVTNSDDDTAVLTITNTTISVNEDVGMAEVTMTLTPAVTAGDVMVDLTTTDGTATIAGGDYTAITSQTLTFTAGSTSETLNIPINDDNIDETDETFTVTLDNLMLPTELVTSDVTITDATAEVTITDDDTLSDTINLSVSPLSVAETADATEITVTATIEGTAVSTMPTTVTVSVDGGTATSGTDYTAVPSFTLNIPALSSSATQTFMIDPTEDTTDDNNETVEITGTASGFTTINPATLTIVEAGISVHDAMMDGSQISTTTIAEASGTGMLYVQLASPPTGNVTLSITSDDTNEGTVSTPALTFSDTNWNTRQLITVTAVDDNVDRDDSFTVNFGITTGDGGNYEAATLTLPSVAVTVTDDDTAGLTVVDGGGVTTSEGSATPGTFTVVLDTQPTDTVTVTITGLDAGEHSLAPSDTLTFTPTDWNRAQTVTLTGINDNDVDGNQTYDLTLTPTGGGYGGVTAETVSITNTDDDTAALTIADLTIDENAGTATLTVTLTPAVTAGDITVDLTTADGTATSTDYTTITSQALTITAGSTSETLSITINDDNIAEIDETFTVMLDNLVPPTGVTTVSIADSAATVTITDNDVAGIAVFDGPTGNAVADVTTSEGATTDTFYVALESQPTGTVTVTVTSGDPSEGTITTGASLTFTATDWNSRQPVTVTGQNDDNVDGDQTYDVTLTASGGDYAGVTAETVSITNTNDDRAELTISDLLISVDENAGTATVTVTLSAPVTAGDITVELTTADGTAEAGEDYTALISETLTITAGSTSETLDITINDDNIAEVDETFTVTLSNVTVPAAVVSDVGPSDNATTITITDDETAPTAITLSVSQPTIADTADATEITVTATIDGTVVLSAPTDISVSVGSATDSATEGTDYVTVPDFDLTIPALMTSAIGTFTIDPNTSSTNGETITIDGTSGTFTFTATTLTIVEAGISVFESQTSTTQISTFTIAEASSDTFYVELASPPTGNVTLTLTSDDTNEGMVSPGTLTFTTTNWNTRQPVTVTAVNDNIDRDGDSFMVGFMVMSGDGGNYTSSLMLPSVAVTVSDDDTASDTINLSISPPTVAETAGVTTITVTATLDGALSTMATEVVVTVGGTGDTADEGSDYTLSIPTATLTITILELMTSGNGTFTITPIADNENDNEETITISGTATGFNTVNPATLTITGFSEEEQQVIEQTVAAQASSVTQVVSENIGSFLASRTSAPPAAPAPPAPDGGGGGDINRENFTSIDWQDWQHRFAKLAYEGIQRLDSDADMSLDWALKAAGGDGRLLMPLGVESLTLWAAGGRLKTKGDGMGEYDGGVNSFVVGVDTNLINNWLLGIAASYSDSQVDYTMDGNPIGTTEQNLFSVHPFLSHSLPDHGLTLWVTGGYGVGDIDFSHTTNDEATSDVTQWMAAGGIEKHIITNTLWQGALRLKGLWGNATVDATEYDNGVEIRKVESTFWRARMESEMGYNFPLPGANVRPYALIGGRWDHNDAIVSGDEWHIDIGGGVEVLSGNAFALNISLHTQLTDGDTEEDSIIGTGSLTYDIGHDGQGLQITLSRPLNNTSPAWDQHSFNEVTDTVNGINSAPLTSELAYGWTVHPFGLKGALQTYIQNSFDSSDRHYAVGLELAVNALTLNFETGYHDHTSLNSGETDNTGLESMFKTKIRW